MKKVLSIALCLAISAFLVACGDAAESSSGTKSSKTSGSNSSASANIEPASSEAESTVASSNSPSSANASSKAGTAASSKANTATSSKTNTPASSTAITSSSAATGLLSLADFVAQQQASLDAMSTELFSVTCAVRGTSLAYSYKFSSEIGSAIAQSTLDSVEPTYTALVGTVKTVCPDCTSIIVEMRDSSEKIIASKEYK